MSNLKLSEQVQAVMLTEGITTEELNTMVESAALTSHERGNRRFHLWVFQMTGDTVQRMSRLLDVEATIPQQHLSSGFTVRVEHDPCESNGCKECGYAGYIVTTYTPAPARKRLERAVK